MTTSRSLRAVPARSPTAGNSAHTRLAASYDLSRMSLEVDVAGGAEGRRMIKRVTCGSRRGGIQQFLSTSSSCQSPSSATRTCRHPLRLASAHRRRSRARQRRRCDRPLRVEPSEAVPDGGDVYTLRNIIHDWEDDRAIVILMTFRRAMGDGARPISVEPGRFLLCRTR
jgi:hypothetical protein